MESNELSPTERRQLRALCLQAAATVGTALPPPVEMGDPLEGLVSRVEQLATRFEQWVYDAENWEEVRGLLPPR